MDHPFARRFLLLVLSTGITLVGLELVGCFIERSEDKRRANEIYDHELGLLVDEGATEDPDSAWPWNGAPPPAYRDEFRRMFTTEYYPFIEWRRKPGRGKFINVSDDGVRSTWNPAGENLKTIWCFGGSTMWGTGARDNFTIPSLLSKKLNAAQPAFRVTNYGESGYILLQELVYLSSLLSRGERPDCVIFYDGLNDFWFRDPGQIGNFWQRRMRFRDHAKPLGGEEMLKQGFLQVRLGTQRLLYEKSAGYRMVRNLAVTGIGRSPEAPAPEPTPTGEASPARSAPQERRADGMAIQAQRVSQYYADCTRIVEALGQKYGFQCVFVIQPAKMTTPKIPQEGAVSLSDLRPSLYTETVQAIMALELPHVHDLTTVLAGEGHGVFLDRGHITESGNAVVADALFRILQKRNISAAMGGARTLEDFGPGQKD